MKKGKSALGTRTNLLRGHNMKLQRDKKLAEECERRRKIKGIND